MASTSVSEKRRLLPVIVTILKLTQAEKIMLEDGLNEIDTDSVEIKNTLNIVTNSWDTLWGTFSSVHDEATKKASRGEIETNFNVLG